MASSTSHSVNLEHNSLDVSNQQPQPPQPASIMPSIPLAELPLRPSTVSLLKKRGFITTAELEDARVSQGVATLAAELDLTLPETANLLMEVQGSLRLQDCQETNLSDNIDTSVAIPPILDARDLLLNQKNHQNHIVTYCQDLDQLLGGGIALGQVTEVCGLPGAGKTQLAMQLAVMCRLPKPFGGVEGKTLYIDAEGSFAPERCAQMATALAQHVQIRSKRAQEQQPGMPTKLLTERDFLESIQVFRVHDEASQTATLQNLPQYLDSRDAIPVKLIVVDSIAFHYRALGTKNNSYQHYGQRTKSLVRLAGFLADLARSHHLAVVCINQMTTKMSTTTNTNTETKSSLAPALGESWAHAVTTRLMLHTDNHGSGDSLANHHRQWRTCQLVKSPHRPAGMVTFQITPQGIRRVPNRNHHRTSQQQNHPQPSPLANPPRPNQMTPASLRRRPLQPHNLKPPPSYSKSTPRGNHHPAAAADHPTPNGAPNRFTPNPVQRRLANNHNTPHHRTVTPHPLSNPPPSSTMSNNQQYPPRSTPDLEGLKRRRLL